MNFLFEGWWHHKNRNGIELMINEGMEVDFEINTSKKYDWIVSLSEFKTYKNHEGGVIYGPHIDLKNVLENVTNLNSKSRVNMLSAWLVELSESIVESDKYLSLPFAVDVNKFTPKKKTGRPVIYFKDVDYSWFICVKNKLFDDFLIFDYSNKYNEVDFLESISTAPYAIWLGRHESQGFAFQETLSCNTPIFVIDVKSLRDEVLKDKTRPWSSFFPEIDLKATAASYFDECCGLITDIDNWENDYLTFIKNLDHYSPRGFIVEKLSPKSCFDLWINTLNNEI